MQFLSGAIFGQTTIYPDNGDVAKWKSHRPLTLVSFGWLHTGHHPAAAIATRDTESLSATLDLSHRPPTGSGHCNTGIHGVLMRYTHRTRVEFLATRFLRIFAQELRKSGLHSHTVSVLDEHQHRAGMR